MPVCLRWGISESDSRRSGGGYRVCQPKPSSFSSMILYDASGDVSGGGHVHAFPVVSLGGAQFTLRTDHSSLRWLQKFCNEDGMLARWFMLLGQFSVTFEYRPGAQHANADRMSRQCRQCRRPD